LRCAMNSAPSLAEPVKRDQSVTESVRVHARTGGIPLVGGSGGRSTRGGAARLFLLRSPRCSRSSDQTPPVPATSASGPRWRSARPAPATASECIQYSRELDYRLRRRSLHCPKAAVNSAHEFPSPALPPTSTPPHSAPADASCAISAFAMAKTFAPRLT
jgi:hypothetical protein